MNRGIARQGFALITAVVIGAAILATIVGIATLTVRETRVQAEQSVGDQALAMAERGLADVVTQFRATDQTLAKTVIALGDNAVWELPPSSGTGGTVSPGGHAFYWVKVVPQVPQDTRRDYVIYAAGFIVRPDVRPPFSTDLKTLAVSTTDVIARRIVQLTGTMSSKSPGSWAFDYGMFTGDTFTLGGSKDLTNVTTDGTLGIYAKRDITMNSNHTLTNLELYAEGAIHVDGVTVVGGEGTVASISNPNYTPKDSMNFPNLDLEKYMDWFDAFTAGEYPFDGSEPGYPDLRDATLRSAVLSALGNPQNNLVTVAGQQHHFVTPASLSNYADKVVSGTLPGLSSDPILSSEQKSALKSTLSKSVFYVRNSVGDADAKWQSDRADLAGIIVCSGQVTFTGCPYFADGQEAAILAKGDINIEGGTKGDPVRGIFYSEGGVKYTGGGSFEGQVISQDTVDWGGSGNVTFKDYSKKFGFLLPGTMVNGFSQNPSGWTEKAWLDFLNLPA